MRGKVSHQLTKAKHARAVKLLNQGLTFGQIGKELNCSPSVVKDTLHKLNLEVGTIRGDLWQQLLTEKKLGIWRDEN